MTDLSFDILIKRGRRTLVDLREFRILPGTMTFLLGESGIGKTLSAKAIMGFLDSEDLSITVNGASYVSYIQSGVPGKLRQKRLRGRQKRSGRTATSRPMPYPRPRATARARSSASPARRTTSAPS